MPRQPTRSSLIRFVALTLAAVALCVSVAPTARSGTRSTAGRIAVISHQVFGPRWRSAVCIAHYESTDGAHLYNGANLGPWQISASAHPWANRWRLVHDWLYSARVAYRISFGGRNWSAWSTRRYCGL